MERMTAVCGLDCGGCEARLATVANDAAAKARVAAEWRKTFHHDGIDESYVTCEGCTSVKDVLCGWCRQCPIRACAVGRGLPNCGHCAELDACATYGGMFKEGTPAKEALLAIRAAL